MNYFILKGPSLNDIKGLLENDTLEPNKDGFIHTAEGEHFETSAAVEFSDQLRLVGRFTQSGVEFDILVKRGTLEAVMLKKFIQRNVDSFEHQLLLSTFHVDEAV